MNVETVLTMRNSGQRSWMRFRQRRSGLIAAWILAFFLFISLTAEIWANSKPLLLNYHGRLYFPAIRYYHPSEFSQQDLSQMDYTKLRLGRSDWAIWPVIRWDPYQRNEGVEELPSPPSPSNILGTDEAGRDVAARLLYGFRYSIAYAVTVWGLSSLIGSVLGAWMGYRGGWLDLLGQRLVEVVESVPYLMILITVASIFRPNFLLLAFLTTLFGWVHISVYFRSEFIRLRNREFVEAARALGGGDGHVIRRHILPNSLTPWITYTPFLIAGHITGLAMLDFLGFGLPPPTPSWGELLNQALKNFRTAWWLALYPSLALISTLLLLNYLGDAIREALDPRHK